MFAIPEGINIARQALVKEGFARPMQDLEKRKPAHGNCCTCQDCGWDFDSCICKDLKFHAVLDELEYAHGY